MGGIENRGGEKTRDLDSSGRHDDHSLADALSLERTLEGIGQER